MKQKLLLLAFFLWNGSAAFSQGENESPRNFGANKVMVTGHGMMLYSTDSSSSNFGDVGLSVKFLAKLSERLFIEPEIEIATDEGDAHFGLEQMNMVYMAFPNMMI